MNLNSMSAHPMRFLFFIALMVSLSCNSLRAQSFISGTLRGYSNNTLSLSLIRGDVHKPLDSLMTDAEGGFTFQMPKTAIQGMYVLKTHDGQSLKLIYLGQAVRLISNGLGEKDQVEFLQSPDNTLWHNYLTLDYQVTYQQELLKPILNDYPNETEFYGQATAEYKRLQLTLRAAAEKMMADNPNLWASRLIRTDLTPSLDLSKSFEEQREEVKKQFFSSTDFSDTTLIYTDVLNRKLIEYIALYQRPGMNMAETQLAFIRALDVITREAAVDNRMYSFVIEYLLRGFSKMGLNAVTDFLGNLPHFDRSCMEPEVARQFEQAILPYQKVVTGVVAPQINAKDIFGKPFNLNRLESERTLILFWSTSCPHCLELLPLLKDFADQHKLKVVSIILSPDDAVLHSIIDTYKLDWVHIRADQEWESQLVADYVIYATPTMFLLGPDKKILCKPINFTELKDCLLQEH